MTDDEKTQWEREIVKTIISLQIISSLDKNGVFDDLEKEENRKTREQRIEAPYQLRKLGMRK